jgi:hypothetical protein
MFFVWQTGQVFSSGNHVMNGTVAVEQLSASVSEVALTESAETDLRSACAVTSVKRSKGKRNKVRWKRTFM